MSPELEEWRGWAIPLEIHTLKNLLCFLKGKWQANITVRGFWKFLLVQPTCCNQHNSLKAKLAGKWLQADLPPVKTMVSYFQLSQVSMSKLGRQRASEMSPSPLVFPRLFLDTPFSTLRYASEVSELQPMAKFGLRPIFVSKLLLAHSHTHLCIVYGCFCVTITELSNCGRDRT